MPNEDQDAADDGTTTNETHQVKRLRASPNMVSKLLGSLLVELSLLNNHPRRSFKTAHYRLSQ